MEYFNAYKSKHNFYFKLYNNKISITITLRAQGLNTEMEKAR